MAIMAVRFSTDQGTVMTTDSARDKLVDEFSSVLSEAETLLDKASKESGDKARDLRTQVEARLLSAKLKLQELEGEAVDRARSPPGSPMTMFTRGR